MESSTNPEDSDSTLRRPMNAFLLFCKRHRSIVKTGHPWLDNRSCTKMLADMWAVLDWEEKSKYLQLAKDCKLAFMKAHPDYKWCGSNKQNTKGTSPTMRTRKSPSKAVKKTNSVVWSPDCWSQHNDVSPLSGISAGKLADPCDMGGLSLLLLAGEQSMSKPSNVSPPVSQTPLSPKSRLFEFAEMCSDQLDIERNSQKLDTDDEPSPLYKTDFNANCACINTSNVKHETISNLDTCAEENPKVSNAATDNHSTRHAKDDCHHVHVPTRETSVMKQSQTLMKQSQTLRTDVKVESYSSPCQTFKFNNLESSVQCGMDNKQGVDVQDLPSCSDRDNWMEEQYARRTSSRSCKGRLYREFVMEGMLESLQRPERPFNCKKTWRHPDGCSLSDGDDVGFQPSPDKPKRPSRRKVRKRTVSGCSSLPHTLDFDYGEIDVEARLASLPQYSPDQFKPKGRCHRLKKSTCLYKNATFVKKEGRCPARHKGQSKSTCSSSKQVGVTGSRKRKAPKSSIHHLTLPHKETSSQVSPSISGNLRQSVVSNQIPPTCRPYTAVSSQSVQIQTSHKRESIGGIVNVSGVVTQAFTSPLISDSHHLPRTTSHVMTAASSLHRSALTVS